MNIDLATEIKNLNMALIKKLFSMHKENISKKCPSPFQIQIIKYLENNQEKDVHQKDLENYFKVSASAISGVIKAMEKKGIVEKIQSQNDARKNKIVLSSESVKIYQGMINDIKILNEELISGISEKELIEFERILSKMKENLKKEEKDV